MRACRTAAAPRAEDRGCEARSGPERPKPAHFEQVRAVALGGREAALATFFPSAKDINRERVYEFAWAKPGWTDGQLRQELERAHGVKISRRSVTQYRKESALPWRGTKNRV